MKPRATNRRVAFFVSRRKNIVLNCLRWGGFRCDKEPLNSNFDIWVDGIEWRVLRATCPQTGYPWGLATRPSWLDSSHPSHVRSFPRDHASKVTRDCHSTRMITGATRFAKISRCSAIGMCWHRVRCSLLAIALHAKFDPLAKVRVMRP
jgi:hypothetical protein